MYLIQRIGSLIHREVSKAPYGDIDSNTFTKLDTNVVAAHEQTLGLALVIITNNNINGGNNNNNQKYIFVST